VACVAVASTTAAAPCAPRARLDGDADAVARVTSALAALGIQVGGDAAGCPVVVAAVENDRSGGIAVAVRDSTNRSEGRVVSDARLAAAWIDSWIHDDFAPELVPPAAAVVPAAPSTTAHVDATPAAAPALIDRVSLDARYQRSFAFDGTGGSGFAGGACVRVGGACIGAEIAFGSLDVPMGVTRSDVSAAATASYALVLGNVVLSPQVALGAGRVDTDACAPPPCDPSTMMCMNAPPCPASVAHQQTYTPRLGAALRASIALFPHVWLEGTAAIVVVPLAHVDPTPGSTDPNGLMPGTLPGEPGALGQLAVGLRVGAP